MFKSRQFDNGLIKLIKDDKQRKCMQSDVALCTSTSTSNRMILE